MASLLLLIFLYTSTLHYQNWSSYLKSSTITPLVTVENKNQPKTAKIKKASINRVNTLKSDGNENIIVFSRACSPGCLLISLISLLTLITLNTLISWGPTLRNVSWDAFILDMTISNNDPNTTIQSKTFQLLLK
jgi:hypothetical protein